MNFSMLHSAPENKKYEERVVGGTVHLESCPLVLKYNPHPFLQAVSQEDELREVWI